MDNYFITLNNIDVTNHIEKKANLSYLSWAWAWAEMKKAFPDTTYTVYENEATGLPYFTDGKTCMVKTGVTCNGIEHVEFLPVMDFKNRSIPYESVTSMDINKAIQRSLTKACARHGLGLGIYAGEDLLEDKAKEEIDSKLSANLEARIENKKKIFADMSGKTIEDVNNALAGKELTDLKEVEKLLDSWIKKKNGGSPVAYR